MKYLLIVLLLLSGCSTVVPVTTKFPSVPTTLSQPCPPLKSLDSGAKLSDVSKTVTLNYSTYYECAVKLDSWIEWYNIQKKISEGLK